MHLLPFTQQSTPDLFFSLCISSLLKGAARNKSITNVQLAHNEGHQQQVEEVLTCLLAVLKREGGLGGVSVPLKVDWSVPALKSSLSVSSTVRCLVWQSCGFCRVCGISIFESLLLLSV